MMIILSTHQWQREHNNENGKQQQHYQWNKASNLAQITCVVIQVTYALQCVLCNVFEHTFNHY